MNTPTPHRAADVERAREIDNELLAALEQVVPYTWRQMSDFDSVLHDIGVFVRDREAAARREERDAAYARYTQDHRDLVAVMYRERDAERELRALDEAVIAEAHKTVQQVGATQGLIDALAARDTEIRARTGEE